MQDARPETCGRHHAMQFLEKIIEAESALNDICRSDNRTKYVSVHVLHMARVVSLQINTVGLKLSTCKYNSYN